ncbi:MAG: SAM-dependent methyltransferase [Chitinophagaceae bacterium]|nr:MAG: SAM-dependent methyltransferase [Chitinophagaceae bacterium]
MELGFGSGLNAALAFQFLDLNPNLKINYFSLDAYPVDSISLKEFNNNLTKQMPALSQKLELLQMAHWGEWVNFQKDFNLYKKKCFWNDRLEFTADIIFYDAFAPSVQPEMWIDHSGKLIYDRLRIGGIMVTYCVQGRFRRLLEECGFRTERLKGPPGKRIVLRALKE